MEYFIRLLINEYLSLPEQKRELLAEYVDVDEFIDEAHFRENSLANFFSRFHCKIAREVLGLASSQRERVCATATFTAIYCSIAGTPRNAYS